ncbi:MAG TPA: cbb3-type cytochrome c oxidase subunit I [Verrucomicrobiae bacterium]|nr:cbb3-type cytochrome c oxidase subunit I [Verrucomicrobiae bacterium]
MTASTMSPTPTPAASCALRPPTAVVDASTRWPELLMASASVKWLVVALAAGFISFLKLHATGFLAGIPALTYGRLVALQDAVLVYGFACQAAMAIALWLICRLGATPLIGRGVAVIAAIIWNIGVLVGAIGILSGEVWPYAHFPFPYGAAAILLIAFCIYGVPAFMTFAARRECTIYPSLWFVLAGLVFFAWVFASAVMSLWSPNIRGSVAPIIAAWAGNNIITLWLGSIALAAIYYLLPKISGRPLHSYGMAVFAFWLYVLFGQATGMHATAAFPSWIVGLSEYFTILLVLPAIANGLNWYQTLGGIRKNIDDVPFKFAWWGAVFYVVGSIVAAIAAYRPINLFVEFTLFQAGLGYGALLGFIAMSFFGAFAYILPRLTDSGWTGSFRMHYRLSLVGALLIIISLLLGGFIQAGKVNDLSSDYLSVVRSGVMPAGLAIIGFLVMLVGQFSWLWNAARISCACCCTGPVDGGRR